MAHLRKPKSGAPEIAAGPPSVSSIDRFAHQPADPTFPSVVVQTPLSPTSFDFAPADVAAYLTCMATIAQCVRGLECWEAEVFPWSGRHLRVCRKAGGRVGCGTGSSAIWTWELSTSWVHAALRSSLTGCPSGTERSWLWMPLWCHPCMATVRHDGTQQPSCLVAGSAQGKRDHVP